MRPRFFPLAFYDPDSAPAPEGAEPTEAELKAMLAEQERAAADPGGLSMEAVPFEGTRTVRLFNEELDFPVSGTSIIGSNPSMCDFVVREQGKRYVSGRHCRVTKEPGGYYISDLGSANGTLINGKKIKVGAKAALIDGDRITLGRTVLMVEETVS